MDLSEDQKVAQMERSIIQAATELAKPEETASRTAGASMKILGLESKLGRAKRKISEVEEVVEEEPDISHLRKRLLGINDEITKVIQLSPLPEGGDGHKPIELLYASVVIREDPIFATKGHKSSRHEQTEMDPAYFKVANKGGASKWKRNPQISNINTNKTIVCESYSDSNIGSTSGERDEFLKKSCQQLPVSSFPHDFSSQRSPVFGYTHAVSRHTREVTNPNDIFQNDGKIYMLGDAAHGKTTYCMWLLKKWCNAQQRDDMRREKLDKWEKALHEFDFVFLLQFRNVNSSRASVIDMICQDVFRTDKGCHSAIQHVLSSNKYKSLIIMDGLDEWNPNEETRKKLKCQGMPNIPVTSSVSCFFSMRPGMFPTISKMVRISDRVIEILGLSETGMEKAIGNVLLNHFMLKEDSSKYTETYNKIARQLKEKSLKSFMQIPLLAVICVEIWYKVKQVGDSMTSFYAVMVDMLIERAYQKHELHTIQNKIVDCKLPEILSDKANIKSCISVISKLGKVAYEGLLSNETNFQKRKLEKEIGERELQFALDVGLISKKEIPSLMKNDVSVQFFHKSVQGFLAVIYIVTRKEISDSFCKHLSNVKVIIELSYVIMFIYGMCPSLSIDISHRIASVTDSDIDICQFRESPWGGNSTVEELYKLQVRWYRELKYGQIDSPVTQIDRPVTRTDSQVTEQDSPVAQQDSPVTQQDSPVTQQDSPVTQQDSQVTQQDSPVTQQDSPVTQQDSPVTQQDSPVTQQDSPVTQQDSPVTQQDSQVTQQDSPVTQQDSPVTQQDSPVTQQDSSVTQQDSQVTFQLTGVYLNKYSDTETVRVTRELLSAPNVYIRSLYLRWVPTDGERGITNTELKDFLSNTDNTRSLVMVCINGLNTDRSIHTLCVPTLRTLYLTTVKIDSTKLFDNICPPLLKDMTQLSWIWLGELTLGDGGLGLSAEMVHLKRIKLQSVNMSAAGWGKFVLSMSKIEHIFNVVLVDTNIDQVSLTMIRSSTHFNVIQDGMDMLGRYELYFTRVWPLPQVTK